MWKLVLFVALLCCGSEVSGIGCKNAAGQDVDWYILYKLPNLKDVDDGTSYYYFDPTGDGMSKKPINDKNGVLANTLTPYFDHTPGPGVGFIAYNDGSTTNTNHGHSKGLVMMDTTSDSGFWLLHSTPNFPKNRQSNSFYPDSGETNAQTFICVTFDYATFKDIGLHLQYIKAPIFDHHIPPGFHQSLRDAANKRRLDPNTLQTLSFDLKSKNGQEFKRFVSKTSTNVKVGDLYVTIADTININSHVYVQTWGRQAGRITGSYTTPNGNELDTVECISIGGKSWKPGNDHSKWCASVSDDWTCIADSNRAVSQFNRPGGALCIKNKRVTDIFKGFIKNESACKRLFIILT